MIILQLPNKNKAKKKEFNIFFITAVKEFN